MKWALASSSASLRNGRMTASMSGVSPSGPMPEMREGSWSWGGVRAVAGCIPPVWGPHAPSMSSMEVYMWPLGSWVPFGSMVFVGLG